jgi:phage terminase large subunit
VNDLLSPARTLEDEMYEVFEERLSQIVEPRQPIKPVLPAWADKIYDEDFRYKIMYGGRGAGRSWSAARALLSLGDARRIRVLCTREIQNSIRDSVHRLLRDQIKLLDLPYIVTRTEIRHETNGTLFIFEGLRHNVDKIKSMEGIDIAWVEEAERVSHDSWETLIPTIRKDGSQIWITFNPDLESDSTYQRFVVNTPPRTWKVKALAEDNPWLPDILREEREHLYRVDPDAAAHVWGGEIRRATEAQVLKGKYIVDTFDAGEMELDGPYQGVDFGFAQDPTTLLRMWVGPFGEWDNCLLIEHEAYKVGLELDHTVDHWMNNVPDATLYATRADSARPESISYLKRHGMPKIESVAKWQGSVEDGVAFIRQFDKIVIHERCKHTIFEAQHYSYKVDKRSGDILPEIVDKHNHCIDPIRYALAPLIQTPKKKRSRPRVFYPGMKAAS